MPTNWRKQSHISQPYVPAAELSVPFCPLIPAFPKLSECFKGSCSPDCLEAAQPSCLKFNTSWATAFHTIKRALRVYVRHQVIICSIHCNKLTASPFLAFIQGSLVFILKSSCSDFKWLFFPCPLPRRCFVFFHEVLLPYMPLVSFSCCNRVVAT